MCQSYVGMITRPGVDVRNHFGGNQDFPKMKALGKVCSDVWTCSAGPALKFENKTIFKQRYTLNLFIVISMFVGSNIEFKVH